MKLYATTSSEKASKGQGGNRTLRTVFQAGKSRIVIGEVDMQVQEDGSIMISSSVPEQSIVEERQ